MNKCLMVLAIAFFASVSALNGAARPSQKLQQDNSDDGDDVDPDPTVGSWTVGNCIMAQFAMEFTYHPNKTDSKVNKTITVPPSAVVNNDQKQCNLTVDKQKHIQALELKWFENSEKNNANLSRSLFIYFAKNVNESYYGVYRLYAEIELEKYTSNKTNHSRTLELDSGDVTKLKFHTPLDRSFTCKDIGLFPLKTDIQFDKDPPVFLANSTVSTKKLHFDAFRKTGHAEPGPAFRTAIDCDAQPNDIVPIAVGVALAVLVIVVLVAYLVGRRKNRQRGYQSV